MIISGCSLCTMCTMLACVQNGIFGGLVIEIRSKLTDILIIECDNICNIEIKKSLINGRKVSAVIQSVKVNGGGGLYELSII